jgi:hypothetical protein
MFILMIVYDICLFSAQLCYIYVYIRRIKAVCKSRTGVHLGKFLMVRGTLFCSRFSFKRVGVCRKFLGEASHHRFNKF